MPRKKCTFAILKWLQFMDDLHTSTQGHTPRLTADPSQEGIVRIQEMERLEDLLQE
jgi:hypothetical protein